MQQFLDGQVLLFDKPFGVSSFHVVSKVRHFTKIKKVGHAGTLDPLATGLLIICTGKFTKKINEYMGQEKEYTGTFTLGATTPSYDLETEPQNFKDTTQITEQQIHEATKQFIGNILQMPPQFSAIKKDGKRLYESARQGIEVQVAPRPVTISEFVITQIDMPVVHFKVVCGTGTYIRSLAQDFGQALGIGAYMSGLRRTRIGACKVEDAYTISSFEAAVQQMKAAETQSP
jgi:tRNA pseudouridine55 synthase